jgi:MFS family permease
MVAPSRFPRVFLLLWSATFLGFFSFQLLTASLPLYAVTLGANDAAIGLLTGVIALVSLISRPWVGWWLDRGGARWGLSAAGGFFALSAIGFLLSRTIPELIGLRMLSGLGIALSATTSQVLAITLAPDHRRGEALNLLGIATSLGQGLAPPTGIAIAQRIGYPGLFATTTLLGTLGGGLALSLRALAPPQTLQPRTTRVIHTGVLAPGLILAALMLTFGVTFGFLAVHASRRGLSNPGLVFAMFAAGQVLVQALLRRVSDRLGRSAVIGPGFVLVAAGMWTIAGASGVWLLLGGFLSGLGQGMAGPSIYALGSDLVASHERGRAMGTLGVFLEIGIATGAIGGGAIGQAFGLETTFVLAGFVALVAAAAQRWALRPRQAHPLAGRPPA